MLRQLEAIPVPLSPIRLNDLISAIGKANFEATLLKYLHDFCGSDQIFTGHCTQGRLYDIRSMRLDDLPETNAPRHFDNPYWKIDPLLSYCAVDAVLESPLIHRQDSLELPRGEFRDACLQEMQFRDRVLICGREGHVGETTLTLLLVKSVSNGPFSSGDLAGLVPIVEVLLAVLERHNWVKQRREKIGTVLASIEEIERGCMISAGFPKREAEVCARTVSGLTTKAVAQELRIGEQTVLTYRKRIYHRLQISSHQELVQWCLKLWGYDVETVPATLFN